MSDVRDVTIVGGGIVGVCSAIALQDEGYSVELIDRGRVLASYPIRSTLLSSSGGAWYRPDIDQRRVAALLENNALWIRRYLGG